MKLLLLMYLCIRVAKDKAAAKKKSKVQAAAKVNLTISTNM